MEKGLDKRYACQFQKRFQVGTVVEQVDKTWCLVTVLEVSAQGGSHPPHSNSSSL